MKSVGHISKEALEQYVMRTLPGLNVEPVEEHLLTLLAVSGPASGDGRVRGGDALCGEEDQED